jgi:hypothetical protein
MERRKIRFDSFDAVRADLAQLASRGYTKTGKWDLSQIAEHLADWASYPMAGFPPSPWIIRMLLGLMRVTRGKALMAKFVQDQRMSENQPTIANSLHEPNPDHDASIDRLLAAIERIEKYDGPIHPSPLFGAMDKQTMEALQRSHMAHHLSFLVPK